MSLGNFALFCSHAAGLGSQFQLLLLVLLVKCNYTTNTTQQGGCKCSSSDVCSLNWKGLNLSIGFCFISSSSVANSSSENWKKDRTFHRTIGEKSGIRLLLLLLLLLLFCFVNILLTHEAFLCLSQLFIPAAIVVACVPSNLPVFITMCILMGFSVATMFLLPWWA